MANSELDLSSLNGNNGFIINGIDRNDYSGFSVSSAGDINGDGIDDLIIGGFGADPIIGGFGANPNGIFRAGESYVIFGSSSDFSSSLNLSSLNGNNGFTINGIDRNDLSGRSVSSAGDINGDGIDDLVIGASNADPNGNFSAGESYVIFGSSSGFSSNLRLSRLNGNNGFVINGTDEGDYSGGSVSSAGDINGDGIDDLIIGASNADPNGNSSAGESYVVFGSSSDFSSSLNLSSLNGNNGFIINGIDRNDLSGVSVSSAGDINGDGIDDLIIGASSADPNGNFSAGESYVVFGSSSDFSSSLNLSSLNGNNGFIINGIDEGDYSGFSVSSVGDVNGDGIDDLIIGARSADPNGNSSAGESYVIFGSSSGFSGSLNLSSLNGNNGFIINGIDEGDFSSGSVSSAGDVNGDGIDDLIIGAFSADPNGNIRAGESYVVFGFKTINGTSDNDLLTGTANTDRINGLGSNDLLIGNQGNDDLTGGGDRDRFAIAAGDGTDTITDFGGVGTGINPTQAIIDEVDTLQFFGSGLTPENMLLTQNGPDLEIIFEGVDDTKVILQNFNLEDLDNLTTENSASLTIGNILFDGQIEIEDSFDVVNTRDNRTKVFNRNTVTFLNDQNNRTSGFSNSDDVINAQGGDDSLSGRSGNDLLRGGLGDDTLVGNTGSDTLNGNEGSDLIIWNNGDGSDLIDGGSDPFVEPHEEEDPRAIDTVRVNASPDEGDEFQLNSGGTEVLFQRTNLGPFELDISSVEELEVNGRGGNDSLEVGDLSRTSIETIFFNGGAGNDVFDGSNATTRLVGVGGSGDDVLIGGNGTNSFEGSDGNDIILGSDGSDELIGGTGNDFLVGGNDFDVFRFFSDLLDGQRDIDTIQDFQALDTLDFFTDYIGSEGTIEFTRVSSGFLQINLSGEDVVNVFGSQSALNEAEAQLTNQIENFDIFP